MLVNVLLVLAVVVTSWFATQQSLDERREEDNAFTVARTMRIADRYASNSARLTRKRSKATTSSVSSSVRPGLSPSDPGLVLRGQTKSIPRHGSTATATSEEEVPRFARGESAYAAMVTEENKGRGDPGSDDSPRLTQYLSFTML